MPAAGPAGLPLTPLTPVGARLANLLLVGMGLSWLLAIVIAVWGAMREAREVEREERHELVDNPTPGPTPGIEGLMNHWGLVAVALLALGLVLLVAASAVEHL